MHVIDILKFPTFAKFMRDITKNKRSMNLEEQVAMIRKYPFEDKIPVKLGDPGIPMKSCSIGNIDINNVLCDIGAGVSIMPLTLHHKLNLGECILMGITL